MSPKMSRKCTTLSLLSFPLIKKRDSKRERVDFYMFYRTDNELLGEKHFLLFSLLLLSLIVYNKQTRLEPLKLSDITDPLILKILEFRSSKVR